MINTIKKFLNSKIRYLYLEKITRVIAKNLIFFTALTQGDTVEVSHAVIVLSYSNIIGNTALNPYRAINISTEDKFYTSRIIGFLYSVIILVGFGISFYIITKINMLGSLIKINVNDISVILSLAFTAILTCITNNQIHRKRKYKDLAFKSIISSSIAIIVSITSVILTKSAYIGILSSYITENTVKFLICINYLTVVKKLNRIKIPSKDDIKLYVNLSKNIIFAGIIENLTREMPYILILNIWGGDLLARFALSMRIQNIIEMIGGNALGTFCMAEFGRFKRKRRSAKNLANILLKKTIYQSITISSIVILTSLLLAIFGVFNKTIMPLQFVILTIPLCLSGGMKMVGASISTFFEVYSLMYIKNKISIICLILTISMIYFSNQINIIYLGIVLLIRTVIIEGINLKAFNRYALN